MVPETEYPDRDPPLPESRRTAHRVFRSLKGGDRFNPFRHIPWDYPKEPLASDPEAANGTVGDEGNSHGVQGKSEDSGPNHTLAGNY